MNGNSQLIGEVDIDGSESDFLRAVDVWISKPHVINRRLCGIKRFYSKDSPVSFENDTISHLINEIHAVLPSISSSIVLEQVNASFHKAKELCNPQSSSILAQKLLPRHSKHENGAEIVILDKLFKTAIFIPVYESDNYALTPKFTYAIQLRQEDNRKSIALKVLTTCASNKQFLPVFTWLRTCVLPKLKKWSENLPVSPVVPSLSAVSVEKYNDLYLHLKEKYGPELVKKWQEKTDPHKYVYEDIAIATYLLLLWEQEREERRMSKLQRFIDLGCGNGLLVHILANEGFEGYGLDVRKRNIWDFFGSSIVLKESPIILSPLTKYPECDWLIGNHSDELTPWIPVFASRSSYDTRFFLLPCCCYDFNCKFQRPNSITSQYRSYINYITEISEMCGFHVKEDKLRIPSTKRICLIGMKRTYPESNTPVIEERLLEYIKQRCSRSQVEKDQHSNNNLVRNMEIGVESDNHHQEITWDVHIPVREGKEVVRNCTQLDRSLIENIVKLVTTTLLSLSEEFIQITQVDGHYKNWNPGGTLKVSDVVQLVDKIQLSKLKKECGGLQTLLKNHGHIFKVMQGTVSLQNYYMDQQQKKLNPKKSIKVKTKPCWFHNNHPNGCPVISESCRFIHGVQKVL